MNQLSSRKFQHKNIVSFYHSNNLWSNKPKNTILWQLNIAYCILLNTKVSKIFLNVLDPTTKNTVNFEIRIRVKSLEGFNVTFALSTTDNTLVSSVLVFTISLYAKSSATSIKPNANSKIARKTKDWGINIQIFINMR